MGFRITLVPVDSGGGQKPTELGTLIEHHPPGGARGTAKDRAESVKRSWVDSGPLCDLKSNRSKDNMSDQLALS